MSGFPFIGPIIELYIGESWDWGREYYPIGDCRELLSRDLISREKGINDKRIQYLNITDYAYIT